MSWSRLRCQAATLPAMPVPITAIFIGTPVVASGSGGWVGVRPGAVAEGAAVVELRAQAKPAALAVVPEMDVRLGIFQHKGLAAPAPGQLIHRSEEHTSELQSREN